MSTDLSNPEPGGLDPDKPKTERLMRHLMEEIEMGAISQRQGHSGLDVSKLQPQQVDRFLDLLFANEQNAFSYQSKRLDIAERIQSKAMDGSIASHRTFRISFIVSIVSVLSVTLIILLLKEAYFTQWLSFVMGLIGGAGLTKITGSKDAPIKTPESALDEE